ncbi:MFS transporter, partial [Glycomyces tenuis]
MDADALLASLRRRFVLITALNWLPNGIGMAVLIVLMDSRGLPLGVTGLIVALYSLTTVLLELPTGGLADVISRRGVLAVSAGLGSLAFCGLAVAASAWQFGVLYVLLGMARALSSGPAEAWYVDSVKAVRPHADIRKGLAASQTAGAVSLGAGTIGGGALALAPVFPDSGAVTALSAPMLLSALLNVVLLIVVVTGMRETARPSDGGGFGALLAGVPRTIASGAALGVRDRALGRLLTTALPIGIAVSSVELLTPGRLLDVTGDSGASAGAYGVITAIGFAANAVGSAASGLLASLLGGGGARTAVAGTLVSALGLVALFTTGSLEGTAAVAAAAGGYALMFLGLGLRGPVHAELTHHRVDSGRRATVISVQSLLMQGGGSLAALTLPLLAGAWSIPGAWLVAGLILAASAALYLGAGTPPFAGRRAPDRVVEQGTA